MLQQAFNLQEIPSSMPIAIPLQPVLHASDVLAMHNVSLG